jgi:hypothetical protein
MSEPIHSAKSTGHGGYERTDIGVATVVYFLLGLAVTVGITYFIVDGMYRILDQRFNAAQTPVSPLVTNPPVDTRRLPPEYQSDAEGRDYEKYLQKRFPQPQLETDEQSELNRVRLGEEDTLSTYDYVDKSAGTVRIPIERAMELIAQRGLPVRSAAPAEAKPAAKGNSQ